jgi:ankyrin repeat protein
MTVIWRQLNVLTPGLWRPTSFKWIFLAKRPLSVDELRHALAVEDELDDLDRDNDNLREPNTFLNCCLDLATIDTGTKTVRFYHSSLSDYFAEPLKGPSPTLKGTVKDGHSHIARICLRYIQFRPLTQDISLQTGMDSKIRGAQSMLTYPLLGYASCQWGHHVRNSSHNDESLVELAQSYLSRSLQERYWSQWHLCNHIVQRYLGSSMELFVISFSQWHIMAYFGIHSLLSNQEPSIADLDSRDHIFGRSPMSWAASNGYKDVVLWLLEKRADPNSEDYQSRTPLLHAAANGHRDIAQLMLMLEKGADIYAKDISGGTALHWAALKGHKPVMSLLLNNGANIHTEDAYGGTPLAWAIEQNSEEVIQLLLDSHAATEYSYGAIAGKIEDIYVFAIGNDLHVKHLAELHTVAQLRLTVAVKKHIDDGFLWKFKDYITGKPNKLDEMKEEIILINNLHDMKMLLGEAEDKGVTPISRSRARQSESAARLLLQRAGTTGDLQPSPERTIAAFGHCRPERSGRPSCQAAAPLSPPSHSRRRTIAAFDHCCPEHRS